MELVNMLQVARDKLGEPIEINSGSRCVKHNKAVGGKPDSSHPLGLAADPKVKDSIHRLVLHYALWEAGFRRFGHKKGYVHIDIDPRKPKGMWL